MGLDAMTYIPSFMKNGLNLKNLLGKDTSIQIEEGCFKAYNYLFMVEEHCLLGCFHDGINQC
jgi:hypothetical protein